MRSESTDENCLHLFGGYGLELEYMLVLKDSLDVASISDRILRDANGEFVNELEDGDIGWSNEFVMHVLELRNSAPASDLRALERSFNGSIQRLNVLLEEHGCMLMPGSMHPWMIPQSEVRFWPHANRVIYSTYDRIFNCRQHGWGNIQSMQINLPFCGDSEFCRLHTAVRLVLPLIPSIAASSPFQEGKATGYLDTRLAHYSTNQIKIPSICGSVIPEPSCSGAGYRKDILERMYRDIAPFDPEGVLRHEWLNSRGAIARFDRSAIEIRLPDIQEFAGADIAIAAVISSTIKDLVSERWSDHEEQKDYDTLRLRSLFDDMIKTGEDTKISDKAYLNALGISGGHAYAKDIWAHLLDSGISTGFITEPELKERVRWILDNGTLARRILKAAGGSPDRKKLHQIYNDLCSCLSGGLFYAP